MEYIQVFKNYLFALKPTPSKVTVKNYSLDIKHFLSWLESKKQQTFDPKTITLSDIENFVKESNARLSTRSLDRHISSLRKFFQCLKLEGFISASPFEKQTSSAEALAKADPFHLKQFKDFLYVYNASNLTIKNYIIDAKQFFAWAEAVLGLSEEESKESILPRLTNSLLEEYRNRLASEKVFSYASINRKLSSLRKYITWANSQNLLSSDNGLQISPNAILNIPSAQASGLPNENQESRIKNQDEITSKQDKADSQLPTTNYQLRTTNYSPFPPFRLAQKISKGITYVFDAVFIAPLTHAVLKAHKLVWVAQGKPLFTAVKNFSNPAFPILNSISKFQPQVSNIKKALYAPLEISTRDFTWYQKVIHHARHTRPNWYKRYHSLAIAHYFNWAILIIIMTALGFGFYNSFIQKPGNGQPLLAAASPPRILSFQGRLTDSSNNPITSFTNLRFAIYNSISASGSALQWQEVQGITPDSNGVFSVLLGTSTGIPQSLFANNQNLFLGITVGQTPELTPRQQLATVAYATNAETLQGLPPITQGGAGTTNVVLALNSSGNLSIGAASTFQTVGGAFTLSGDTLVMNTNAGTNGNITIAPDGKGFIDLQKPLQNSTNNNNILSATGSVEVDDTLAILSTSSGIPAVTINQDGTGDLFTASTSGVSKFTIANSGAVTASSYNTAGGVLYTDGTGLFLQTTTGLAGQCLTSAGGAAPTWSACGSSGTGSNGFWTLASGALYPVNETTDLFVGGTSTDSAKFSILNINTGTPTASVSSGLNGTAAFLTATGTLETARNQGLTLGGATTGNIILKPLNGTGTITFAGYGTGIIHSTGGLLSSSAINLASGDVTGILPLANGGTNNNLVAANGGIVYSDASKLQILAPAGSAGQCLLSGGAGAPSWLNCSTASNNFWGSNNGSLYPLNSTLDLFAGGSATASAKFAVLNLANGTPTASVSSGLNGFATFITADGTLQTTRNQGLTIGGPTTGNITLSPLNGTGYITISGTIHSNLIPTTTDTYDLGSSTNEWRNLYVQNIISGGNFAGFWQRFNGVLSPTNITDDLAIGGTATIGAKFQVFGNTGNATTTGTLTFTGLGSQIQTTSNQTLTLGGNSTGGITLSPNNGTGTVTINGTSLVTSATIIPTSTAVNLGSPSNYFGSAYITNLFTSPASQYLGFWQRLNGVLSPINITDDLAIGGTATSSSKFQVFGDTGNATTAGNFVFTGLGSQIQTTSNQPLTLGGNTTGGIVLSPNNGTGTVTITGLPTGVVHSTSGVLSSSTVSLTSDVSGILPILNGGTNTSTIGAAGSVAYSNGTSYAFTGVGITGDCLVSNGSGTPNWTSCSSAASNNYWNLDGGLGILYPKNETLDVLFGGSATSSAKFAFINDAPGSGVPTASISGNLTLNSAGVIQTTNNQLLTIGGDTTGNIILSPLNGNGTVTINGTSLLSIASSFNLFTNTTALSIGAASGTTTVNNALTSTGTLTASGILNVTGTSNLNGDINLGDATTDTITANGFFGSSLIPKTTDLYDLGSNPITGGQEWNNLYVKNIISTGNVSGFWQRNLGVLSPTNITDDLAVGGVATNTAKFLVFGDTGNATTTGTLTFAGSSATNLIAARSNAGLTIGDNQTGNIILNGGNVGIGTINPAAFKLQVAGNVGPDANNTYDLGSSSLRWKDLWLAGNSTIAGNSIIGGNETVTGTGTFGNLLLSASANYGGFLQRFNGVLSPTHITDDLAIGGTSTNSAKFQVFGNTGNATTTGSLTFTGVGSQIQTTSSQPLTIGGNTTGNIILSPNNGAGVITINGKFNSSLIPLTTNTYDLGSPSLQWANVYANNLISNGTISGFWQRNLGALSPTNITDDLLIGGTATSSSKFQVFGDTGNATTAGSLTFNTNGLIQTTSMLPLVLGSATTGSIQLTPKGTTGLLVDGTGNVGIGTLNPTALLDVNGAASVSSSLTFHTGPAVIQASSNNVLELGGNTTAGIVFDSNVASNLLPKFTNTYDLGSSLLQWNNVYANNIYQNGQLLTQDWQRNLGVLSPLNITDDLAIGGTATSTARFQVFGLTGNATTAGTLTFTGLGSQIQTTSNQALTLGGNSTGNIILSPNNGAGSVTINGFISASLIPSLTDTYDLGSSTNEWRNLYVQNIISGGNFAGFWQRFNNVISPTNISDDLAIGGTSTNSAKFQVFGISGNATTTGTLTFTGLGSQIQTTSNQTLTIGGNSTGGIVLSPNNGTGTVTLSGYATGIIHSTLGVLSSSAIDLASTDVTGILPLNHGGTNANLVADNGGIVYSDATKLQILAHTPTVGQCLLSGGVGAPSWGTCTTGGGTNWWTVAQGALYPTNETLDLILGSPTGATTSAKFAVLNMTGNGTPTASVSAGIGGPGIFITANGTLQTTNNQGLTLGGTTTGNITLSPLAGTGIVTVNGVALNTTSSTFNLLTNATTLGIGASSGTTTVNNALTSTGIFTANNNVVLGTNGSNTIAANGQFTTSLIPNTDNAFDLGSNSLRWRNLYTTGITTNNLYLPVTGGTGGYWTLSNSVLSPTNIWNDLAIGGTATSTAKFQVFANTGNATTAGTLTFDGNGVIQTTNNQLLTLGGNTTGGVVFNSNIASNFLPKFTNTYDLGSLTNQWNNLYANNIYANGQPLTQIWQRNLGTLSPINITDDVLVGGVSTASAKFQIVGLTGNATSAGNLTFNTNGNIQTTSMLPLTLGSATTGPIQLSPKGTIGLFVAGNGNVGIGTTNPAATLEVAGTIFGTSFKDRDDTNYGIDPAASAIAGTFNGSIGIGTTNPSSFKLQVAGNVGPDATNLYDLGSTSLRWKDLWLAGNSTIAGNETVTGTVTAGNLLLTSGATYGGFWQRFNGTVSPFNLTDDLLLGSTATTSAKFAVLNIANGTPTASVSSGLNGNGMYFDANGNIQTVRNAPLTLGGSTTSGVVFGSNVASNLLPKFTNTYDLGSLALQWNTVYANNIYQNGTPLSQVWQRNLGVLSPLAIADDVAVGGTSTSSAKFQIFGLTGNATTAGSLTFNTNGLIQTTSMLPLVLGSATTGSIQLSPKGTTGLLVSGQGNVGINTNNPSSFPLQVAGNVGPDVDNTYDLGSSSLRWKDLWLAGNATVGGNETVVGTLTAGNLILNGSATYGGFFQRFNGVISPINLTDDFAIGGTATSTAKFQVFGDTGNATTTGTLTFNTNGLIQTTNMSPLVLGSVTTGPIQLSPKGTIGLFVDGNGNVGIGTTVPTTALNVTATGEDVILGDGTNTSTYISFAATRARVGYDGSFATLQSGSSHGLSLNVNNNVFGSGTALRINTTGYIGIGTTTIGNAQLVVNQTNFSGLGDIFTASASGATKFVISNGGNLSVVNGVTIDTLTSSGTINIATGTNTSTLVLGKSGSTIRAANLTTNGPVFTSGGNGTLNSELQLATVRGGLGADVTPAGAGELLYSNSSSSYGHLAASVSVGQCLTSNGAAAPSWSSCATGAAGTNWWQVINGALSPINNSLDLLVGATSTDSAKFAVLNISNGTPTASVSSGLNGDGAYLTADGFLQTARNHGLTIGGNTTGNITLSPLNGNGFVTLNGNALKTTSSTFDLINTIATTVNFASAAATLNIGAVNSTTMFASNIIDDSQASVQLFTLPSTLSIGGTSQSTILEGNTTLGASSSNTVLVNGLVSGAGANNALQPVGNGTTDLGSALHYWGTVYANNFIAPVSGGTSGFWQLTNNVLSPVNSWNDLAVGGNATSSATPFQIFATTVGVNTAGTATTSGNITFRGVPASQTPFALNILNGGTLDIKTSGGGDAGLISRFNLAQNGDITFNGSNLSTSATTAFSLFNTNITSLSLAGSATSANILTGATGLINVGNSSGTIAINSHFSSNILPDATLNRDLGSLSLAWRNLFVGDVKANNVSLPVTGGTGGYWTLSNSVLSPTNIWNDLAIGGTATNTAKFQVFSTTGSATTAGTLTFNGAGNLIQTTNNQALTLGGNTTGNISFMPLNGSGTLTLNTTGVALATLDVRGSLTTSPIASFSGTTSGPAFVIDNQGTGDFLDIKSAGKQLIAITPNGTGGRLSINPGLTDAYDLGSDPNAGGQEWNNLYVRQIFASSTGGVAGYWQLNDGAIAPTNITNDVLVGGLATASATFHVWGASIGQGTNPVASISAHTSAAGLIVDNTVGDLITASSSGLDRFVVKQNGNVGIGIDSPANTLQVAGDLQVGKDTTPWGVTGYSQRRQVTITNNSGTALTNYQVRIVIDTATLITAGKMQSDCDDIRFTDTNGSTNLNFWMENACNTNYTTFWVNVPTIGYPAKTIYAYYNNPSATIASSTTNTFVREITGVAAAYRLDEPTYDPIQDYSGNGNVATASGTTVLDPGKFNKARTFNGTTNVILASDSASLSFTGSFSLGAWVKTNSASTQQGIIEKYDVGGGSKGYGLRLTSSGKVQGFVCAASCTTITGSTTITTGTWNYVTLTYTSGGNETIYLNGVSDATPVAASAPTDGINSLKIGARGDDATLPFNGSIDEARLYNVSLSQAQITDLYGGGGNNVGYVPGANLPGKEEVAAYTYTAPGTYLNPEQNTLQTIPSFYVQATTGNVALGTLSVASTSALLTVAGDIKSGLYDTTTWGSNWSNYSYRARVNIDNTQSASSSANANYVVQVTTNTAAVIANGKMRSDCGDMRFADADGNTSLNYWIETGTCNTASTSASIRVPQLPPAAKKNIYMYYGNPAVTSASSQANTFVETSTGVRAGWRLDETSGTTVTDNSGNGANGIATSSAILIGGGVANNARSLNGLQNIWLGKPDATQITGALTLEAWVRTTAPSSNFQGIIGKMGGGAGTYQYVLRQSNNGTAQMFVSNDGTTATFFTNGTTKINDGKWHHLVGVYTPSASVKIYVDNVLEGTNSTSIPASLFNSSSGVVIGSTYTGLTPSTMEGWNGDIDEVRVYNVSMGGTTITNMYAQGRGYSYVTPNVANTVFVRTFQNPEPVVTVDTEQDPSQVDPTLYVNNTFNRVGIGTANPNATLDIESNANTTYTNVLQAMAPNLGVGNQAYMAIGKNASINNWASLGFTYAGDGSSSNRVGINFYGGSELLSILANGNVGIGTTSPAAPLEVAGTIYGSSFKDRDDTRYFIDPAASGIAGSFNGNVGIGTTSPGGPLDIETAFSNTSSSNFGQVVYVNQTAAMNTTDGTYGYYSTVDFSTTGTHQNLVALQTNPRNTSTGTVTYMAGIASVPQNTSTGTVSGMYAGNFVPINSSTGTVTSMFGVQTNSQNSAGGLVTSMYGLYADPINSSTGTVTTMYGIYSQPQNSSSGTTGTMYAGVFQPIKSGTGVVSTMTGIYSQLQNTNGTGAITTGYGLYIDDPVTTGAITNKYALVTGPNAGNVGIGTTAPGKLLALEPSGNVAPRLGLMSTGGAGTFIEFGSGGNYTNDGAIGYNQSVSGALEFFTSGTGNSRMTITSGGNVGIGTTSTAALLSVGASAGTIPFSGGASPQFIVAGNTGAAGYLTQFYNTNSTAGTGGILLKIAPTTNNTDNFVAFVNGSNATLGTISCNYSAHTCAYNSGSDIRLKENIVQTHFGLADLLKVNVKDFDWISDADHTQYTGFIAQQLYTVFPEAVKVGGADPQTDPWQVDYGKVTPLIVRGIQDLNTKVDDNYASLSAQLAPVALTMTGNLSLTDTQPSYAFTIPHYYTLADALSQPISSMGAFLELVVGNLRVGNVNAQQIFTNSLAIATDNVSIAGQRLSDYIVSVVNNAISSGAINSLSPIASVNQLHVGVVSPLGQDNSIALSLSNSRVEIRNGASGSAVAVIDNVGNATFSGTLMSQNLAVNQDATISGTLHAHKIVADEIEGLSAAVGTLSAQNITNVNNIYFSSPSANTSGGNYAMGQGGNSSSSAGLLSPYLGYTNIASYSGFLAYVPNLSASTAMFDQGLVSLGTTSLGDTTITGQLSIGTQLVLANNSINVLGSSFEIQPLRQGGVNFEGGLLAIDTDGNLTVNGNAVFSKNLAANIISPLSNDRDLTFKLGENSTATGSALATSTFAIQNASGSGIFAINQLGDIVASGAANIGKLNFNLVQPALAVSNTEVIATGSAGTTFVKPNQTEITIDNKLVTDKSLIYITPVGQGSITPYLLRQVPGVSFTVGIPTSQITNTTFNWLIVN